MRHRTLNQLRCRLRHQRKQKPQLAQKIHRPVRPQRHQRSEQGQRAKRSCKDRTDTLQAPLRPWRVSPIRSPWGRLITWLIILVPSARLAQTQGRGHHPNDGRFWRQRCNGQASRNRPSTTAYLVCPAAKPAALLRKCLPWRGIRGQAENRPGGGSGGKCAHTGATFIRYKRIGELVPVPQA